MYRLYNLCMKFFLHLHIEKKNFLIDLQLKYQNCAAKKSMWDFLFSMGTYNAMQTIDKIWSHIGIEKEKKKKFSRICNFLFSMETFKTIQTIDKMCLYTFELRKRRNFLLRSVCNFQSMKSPMEVNSLLSKFFCYITWFVIPPD